jgi:hypothetical protein
MAPRCTRLQDPQRANGVQCREKDIGAEIMANSSEVSCGYVRACTFGPPIGVRKMDASRSGPLQRPQLMAQRKHLTGEGQATAGAGKSHHMRRCGRSPGAGQRADKRGCCLWRDLFAPLVRAAGGVYFTPWTREDLCSCDGADSPRCPAILRRELARGMTHVRSWLTTTTAPQAASLTSPG